MSTTSPPELPFVLFAFLLHFAWEMLQAPLWVGMAEMPHWQAARACTVATLGDVIIALVAFWAGAVVAQTRRWLLSPKHRAVIAYVLVGLVLTVAYEYLATGPLGRWEYTASQPRLPWIGTGIAPVLQWLTLPFATLWLARAHCWGRIVLSQTASGNETSRSRG